MQLNVNFRSLEDAVRLMGNVVSVNLQINVAREINPVDPINIRLSEGVEIRDLDEIEFDPNSGVAIYQGHAIAIYIQDQSWKIRTVLEDASVGTKVHVADCGTLREMKRQNRYDRYVVTRNISGKFKVNGMGKNRDSIEGYADLNVCKNCLQKLNFKGYNLNREKALEHFSWKEFFEIYTPYFTTLPNRIEGEFDGSYSHGWSQISIRYREEKNFTCEECHVILKEYPRLLHVHHINGVKTDNNWTNLRALCFRCHRKQPRHGHVPVPIKDLRLIEELCSQQSLDLFELEL